MVMPTDEPQTEAPAEVADQVTPEVENADEPIADIQVFGGGDDAPLEDAPPAAVAPPSPVPAVEAPQAPAPVSEDDRQREEALKELQTRREAEWNSSCLSQGTCLNRRRHKPANSFNKKSGSGRKKKKLTIWLHMSVLNKLLLFII